MKIRNIVATTIFLTPLATAQSQWTTSWVEMLPEDEVIEATGTDCARRVYRAALPAFTSNLGTLTSARVQILANYGTSQQLGTTTPFRYSVEQLGMTPLAGYQGTYGSITYVAVGGQIVGGLGAWLGMCGGESLTSFDGECDGDGASGHTSGNQIGEWSQEYGYAWPNVPGHLYATESNAGMVPVAVLITAQGFITDWQSSGHYFRRWQTHTSLMGERVLSLKVRLVYEAY